MRTHETFLVVIVVFTLSNIFACSVKAQIDIADSGAGVVQATLHFENAVQSYWKDLQELDSKLPAHPFEKVDFQKTLDAYATSDPPLLKNPKVEAPDARTLKLQFALNDWQTLMKGLTHTSVDASSLIAFSKQEGHSVLTLSIDRKSFRQLLSLTAYGNSPALASLIPEEKASVTLKEYRDLLVYMLDPYDKNASTLVDTSKVELQINLPKSVLEASGGKSRGKSVLCSWPLAQVLALETPLKVRIVY